MVRKVEENIQRNLNNKNQMCKRGKVHKLDITAQILVNFDKILLSEPFVTTKHFLRIDHLFEPLPLLGIFCRVHRYRTFEAELVLISTIPRTQQKYLQKLQQNKLNLQDYINIV